MSEPNNTETKSPYTVIDPIRHNGAQYVPGAREITLTDDEAAPLLAVGAISPVEIDRQPVPGTTPETLRRAAIADAIDQLDPNDQGHWTADKKPNTTSISRIMNAVVSAEERDRVWAEMQGDSA